LRIAVIGLGGIGGYFAARLAGRYAGEHEIVLIQRGRHLEAIRASGLRYLTRDHEYLVRPDLVTDDPTVAGPLDMAILCVKSRGLEPASESLGPCLGPESVLLTALNGVDAAERCRKVLPEGIVLPGCIYLSAHIESPGVVRQVGGSGKFYFGSEDGRVEAHRRIEALLSGAGIKAVLDTEITVRLWEKYLFVEPLATLTAATGLSIGRAVRDPAGRRRFNDLMREIMALAAARGVVLSEALASGNLELAERIPPETRTSMQLDIEAGKPAELDVFTEYVLREAERSGVDVPVHRELYPMIISQTQGGKT
jgi:2-dehydropantoate 2-reductase